MGEYGASGRIRTSDRSVRSRVLYPAELRMQMAVRRGFEPRMQLLTAYSLSRGAPSASRPPHHILVTHDLFFQTSRLCVAHILLSPTEKSNNFSQLFKISRSFAQLPRTMLIFTTIRVFLRQQDPRQHNAAVRKKSGSKQRK